MDRTNDKILSLIRERKKYEYRTLDGYRIANYFMYNLLAKEIEIEFEKIGRQNKTLLKKEAKGNPFLEEKLKRGELNEKH